MAVCSAKWLSTDIPFLQVMAEKNEAKEITPIKIKIAIAKI